MTLYIANVNFYHPALLCQKPSLTSSFGLYLFQIIMSFSIESCYCENIKYHVDFGAPSTQGMNAFSF